MATTRETRNLNAARLAQAETLRLQAENEAKAWSEVLESGSTARQKPRYRAQSEMLEKALSGDATMASKVLQYLSSANQDLRRMMQLTIHEHPDELVWRYLIHFLALQTWEDVYWQIGLVKYPQERPQAEVLCAKAGSKMKPQALEGCLQSVSEVFAVDETNAETLIKNQILHNVREFQPASKKEMSPAEVQRWRKVKQAAVYLSGLRGDATVVPDLEEMVEAAAIDWKMRAVQALGVIQDQSCCPALLKALASDDKALHQEAGRILNNMGDQARACWESALQHPDSHIRWHAARGLGQIGDVRAIEVLVEGLFDENQAVRWSTGRVLAHLNATAIPAILDILTRRRINEPTRQAVIYALNAMPSKLAQGYLKPLLEALKGPAASVNAPRTAQRMLLEWYRTMPH